DTALTLDAATFERAPFGKHFVSGSDRPLGALTLLERDPKRLHVGVTVHDFGRSGACETSRANKVRQVAEALARNGHVVEEVSERDLPDFSLLWRSFETYWAGL